MRLLEDYYILYCYTTYTYCYTTYTYCYTTKCVTSVDLYCNIKLVHIPADLSG